MSAEGAGGIHTRQQSGLARAALRETLDAEGGVDREGDRGATGCRADPVGPIERRQAAEKPVQDGEVGGEEGIPARIGVPDPDPVQEDEDNAGCRQMASPIGRRSIVT